MPLRALRHGLPRPCGLPCGRTPSRTIGGNNRFAQFPAIPTVSLDVISLVASSCRHYREHIEQRAAHECAVHVATQNGFATRIQYRHPPRAQPVAPMRERHCRGPRLPSLHRSGPLAPSGTTRWRAREEQQPHRLTMPREALPTRLSSLCLLAMASPPRDTRRNPLISQHTSGIVRGADSRYMLREGHCTRLRVLWNYPPSRCTRPTCEHSLP